MDTPEDTTTPDERGIPVAVFVCRQVVALVIVCLWLIGLGIDLFLTPDITVIPFWLNSVCVGVLAFALGMSVADLTAFTKTSRQIRPPRG